MNKLSDNNRLNVTPPYLFDDYKSYIAEFISKNKHIKGLKSKISQAINIHSAYLPQVLKSEKHLTLEQLEKLSRFLNFSEEEKNYWLTLALENKAGTPELKQFYTNKCIQLKRTQTNISKRLGKKAELSLEAQSLYFSSWIYPSVYMSLSIPGKNTASQISELLNEDLKVIQKALDKLIEINLVYKKASSYHQTQSWIRLEKSSPLMTQLHTQLRLKATDTIAKNIDSNNLHYSSYISFSEKDFVIATEMIYELIEKLQALVKDSPEETVAGLCMDLFKV